MVDSEITGHRQIKCSLLGNNEADGVVKKKGAFFLDDYSGGLIIREPGQG